MEVDRAPNLTVIIISYNTRDLTLAALRTLFETTRETSLHVVVLDNASADGSAEAIAEAFPQVELIRSERNLGFARANNVVAERATTEWLLLLNPDTECHEGAVDNLIRFARETPEAGIWGGRTVFPDGSLNAASCWNRITLWSLASRAVGLSTLFPNSEWFNPEAIGGWRRDSVRQVDIVQGCFLLIRKDLWDELKGFNPKYFMYAEEADLCLRACARGRQPIMTPNAQIMHLMGASSITRADKMKRVMKGRATLIRDHLPAWQVPVGLGLMWLWIAIRRAAVYPLRIVRASPVGATIYVALWQSRADWLAGY